MIIRIHLSVFSILLTIISSTTQAAPTTKVVHERAAVVQLLDELTLFMPFTRPQGIVKQRIIREATGKNQAVWRRYYDNQGRLLKDVMGTKPDANMARYIYDDEGGFEQYRNKTLILKCQVTTFTQQQLSYQCSKGNYKRIAYDASSGIITLEGQRTVFLSNYKRKIRDRISLDEQLRVIKVDKEKASNENQFNGQVETFTLLHESSGDVVMNFGKESMHIQMKAQANGSIKYRLNKPSAFEVLVRDIYFAP